MKRDVNFDYIRITAMVAIVLCHYFQILNCWLAIWFNVGVQIFFVISAKLLSNKCFDSKTEVASFIKSRLLRIYIPVWVYLLCLVPVLYIVGRGPSISGLIMYFIGAAGFAKSGILGLGHFWYITVLLICYLLVPVMYKIAEYSQKQSGIKAKALSALLPIGAIAAFVFTPYKSYGVNIALFCVSYFMFYNTKNDENWYKGKALKLLPVALLLAGARLFLDTTEMVYNPYYDGLFVTVTKAVGGLFLFFAAYEILLKLKARKNKIVDYISTISYEIYIVHQFILLALLEFVPFFNSGIIGKVALLGCALIMSFLNAVVVFYIKSLLKKGF